MLTGFNRGLQLTADFLNMLFWAMKTENQDALFDLLGVMRQWFKELTAADIEARSYTLQNVVMAIVFGRDPFALSRAMFRDVAAKYPR